MNTPRGRPSSRGGTPPGRQSMRAAPPGTRAAPAPPTAAAKAQAEKAAEETAKAAANATGASEHRVTRTTIQGVSKGPPGAARGSSTRSSFRMAGLVTSCSDEDGGEDSDDDAADARSGGGDDGSESDAEADMEGLDDEEESVCDALVVAGCLPLLAGAAAAAAKHLGDGDSPDAEVKHGIVEIACIALRRLGRGCASGASDFVLRGELKGAALEILMRRAGDREAAMGVPRAMTLDVMWQCATAALASLPRGIVVPLDRLSRSPRAERRVGDKDDLEDCGTIDGWVSAAATWLLLRLATESPGHLEALRRHKASKPHPDGGNAAPPSLVDLVCGALHRSRNGATVRAALYALQKVSSEKQAPRRAIAARAMDRLKELAAGARGLELRFTTLLVLLNLSTDRPARARRRAADAGLVRAATRVPRRRAAARFRPRPRLRRPLGEARARGVPRRAVSASGVLGGAGVGPRRRGPRGIDSIRGPSRPHRSIACGAQHRVCEHLCARASLCERAHTLLRAAASRATTARPRCHQPQV